LILGGAALRTLRGNCPFSLTRSAHDEYGMMNKAEGRGPHVQTVGERPALHQWLTVRLHDR
jgi:hypothetical protein